MRRLQMYFPGWSEFLRDAALVAVAWLVLIPLALWRIGRAINRGRNILDEL